MKRCEILARVICDIQKSFISSSFYDDGDRTHSNVSQIGFIKEYSGSYGSIGALCGLSVTEEDAKEEGLDLKYSGEYSGRVEIFTYNNVRVKAMLLSQSGPYSYAGPMILFYKIKGE